MANFGNSMLLADPEFPRIFSEGDSSHVSWTSSFPSTMLSNGGSHESLILKRPHQDMFGGEVADDGEPPRKRKGRPPGSKNKPKQQPIMITRDCESFLNTSIIEISAGHDVIQTLVNFACRINCGITVLSGIGLITHTSLRLPVSQAQPLILNGSHSLLALNGTVLVCSAARMDNNGSSSGYMLPSRSSISVSVAGPQGNVCGGVVAGKLIAGSTVTVVATAFKNPCIHSVSTEVKTAVDPNRASTSANGGGFGICPTPAALMAASNFNVATPVLPLNNQIADDMNVMQWGQPSCTPH